MAATLRSLTIDKHIKAHQIIMSEHEYTRLNLPTIAIPDTAGQPVPRQTKLCLDVINWLTRHTANRMAPVGRTPQARTLQAQHALYPGGLLPLPNHEQVNVLFKCWHWKSREEDGNPLLQDMQDSVEAERAHCNYGRWDFYVRGSPV